MQPHDNEGIRRRLVFSIGFTMVVFVLQLAGGFWTGSLALISDSAHVFMDAFSLGLTFLALVLSSRPPDDQHTYGYHRLEVLAALANGISLAVIALGIFYEAYQRWSNPVAVRGVEMLVIAILGLIANLVVAYSLGGHHHEGDHSEHEHARKDLNLNSAFIHVVGDAVSSVGVIIAAIIIWRTGLLWVDPLVSILIGFLILFGAYRILRPTLHILIEGTPEGLSAGEVQEVMEKVADIQDVHDLHIWNICSGHIALSAHVVIENPSQRPNAAVMSELKKQLGKLFGIEHTTIQFEEVHCGQEHHYC
jgi:cobalt-zinc-cadmium efflux system protein